jgi:1-deoxy-D-xylulose-5-phosphate synthase
LATEENLSVGVVNARFVKPLDRTLLLSHAACIPLLVTLEDHVLAGGFGSAVLEVVQEGDCACAVERLGWPDRFVEHGSNVEVLRAAHGLAPADLHRRVLARWGSLQAERIPADL